MRTNRLEVSKKNKKTPKLSIHHDRHNNCNFNQGLSKSREPNICEIISKNINIIHYIKLFTSLWGIFITLIWRLTARRRNAVQLGVRSVFTAASNNNHNTYHFLFIPL